jgi:two-component system nitrate/nitrite response regulator NarL
MEQTRLALLVPDGVTRIGIEGLIKVNRQANYKIKVFEDFQSFERQSGCMDILLYDTSGLPMRTVENHLRQLANCCSEVRVIVVSDQIKVQQVKQIMQLGAKGFIFRDDLSEALVNSIDLVARDVVTMSPQPLKMLTNADQLYIVNNLKPLDLRVLQLTADGLTVKAIATRLDLSTRTVYRSRDKLREVLGVPTMEMLLDAAREQGLLDCF